jgi:GT2 family glycosyltransferase
VSPAPPLLSVLTPVHDTPSDLLGECIASVRNQTFVDHEHVLVDDASSAPHVWDQLQDAVRRDPRVVIRRRAVNGGIVAASNDALTASTGDVVALLDHDDLLAPTALERMAEVFADDTVDYAYSDEDVLGPDGRRGDPFYKPDWSPERFRNQMYTCHLSAFRRSVVDEVGGFREGFEGSQDWDLVLRVTERARRIVHVPEVLYHWRVVPTSVLSGEHVKPYAYESARRALSEHAERIGLDADVVELPTRGFFHLVRRHRTHPLVSVVVPSRGSSGRVWGVERVMVLEAVRSILERSSWPHLEIVVVLDRAAPDEVREELVERGGGRVRIVDWDRPFDFSAKCNLGALHARGEHLVFLNDDVEVVDEDWLDVLVGFTREADVGAAGLLLLFEDGRVQHAGHVHLGGSPGHLMFGQMPDSDRNRRALALDREVAGVTAACLAVRADVFDEVGGFSPEFPGNYNDVDLCLKLRTRGLRVVVSARARLFHFESVTRDPTVRPGELEHLRARWLPQLRRDPFYNPNYGERYDNYPNPLTYP